MTAKKAPKTPELAKAKGAGRPVADFRSAHDKSFIVPQKIEAALKKLGDGWEYEAAFLKLAELSVTDLAKYRPQFEDYIVMTTGPNAKRVWSGTKELAAQLRTMV